VKDARRKMPKYKTPTGSDDILCRFSNSSVLGMEQESLNATSEDPK
jgi:hypothetical protein